MPWTKWALVPNGVVGKTKHYWGVPEEVAPDAERIDMPPARILLIDEVDDKDIDQEQSAQMMQALDKLVAGFESRGTRVVFQESESDDVGLYRYADDGEFAGDTLHDNLKAAFNQANWEYDSILDWHAVPASLANAKVDRKVIEALLKSLPS
jgi:hypothetical protein